MRKLTLNLPLRYRIDLHLVKARDVDFVAEPFIPRLHHLKSFRTGNKVSRVFRHMLEHKKLNRVLGGNLAAAAIVASGLPYVMPQQTTIETNPEVINLVTTTMKTEHGLQLPMDNIRINQGFYSYHPGVDIGAPIGTPIRSIMAGQVSTVLRLKYDYGNHIIIDHGNGITSLYAHLSKIYVKEGEQVSLSTVIGETGSTGRSTGPHLHLEVRSNGRQLNPFSVLPLKQSATFTSILQ